MGSVGDCFDNALTESVWATLTKELLMRRGLTSPDEARTAIFTYIEGFYNPRRRHSALDQTGTLTPKKTRVRRTGGTSPVPV